MTDPFTTDLAPLKKRKTDTAEPATTMDAFKATTWTPAADGLFLTFPDLFDYHGDQGIPGETEAFEFTLRPVADGFELTAYHTFRASHLDDFTDEVSTLEAATSKIESILEQWDYQVSEANAAYARDNADDDE